LKKLLSSVMSASMLLGAGAAFAQGLPPGAYPGSNGPWAVNELSSENLKASTSDSNQLKTDQVAVPRIAERNVHLPSPTAVVR
jgi:hypothetical protein